MNYDRMTDHQMKTRKWSKKLTVQMLVIPRQKPNKYVSGTASRTANLSLRLNVEDQTRAGLTICGYARCALAMEIALARFARADI